MQSPRLVITFNKKYMTIFRIPLIALLASLLIGCVNVHNYENTGDIYSQPPPPLTLNINMFNGNTIEARSILHPLQRRHPNDEKWSPILDMTLSD